MLSNFTQINRYTIPTIAIHDEAKSISSYIQYTFNQNTYPKTCSNFVIYIIKHICVILTLLFAGIFVGIDTK